MRKPKRPRDSALLMSHLIIHYILYYFGWKYCQCIFTFIYFVVIVATSNTTRHSGLSKSWYQCQYHIILKCWNVFTHHALNHWGHVVNLTIICSDNGLSPSRHQIITWTNVGILLVGPSGINFIQGTAFENKVLIITTVFSASTCQLNWRFD